MDSTMGMSNAYLEHNCIVDNFVYVARSLLQGTMCKVFSDGMQYRWDETGDNIYVPDASIVCSSKNRQNTVLRTVPRMVLEVLSAATEAYDRGEKLHAYVKAGVQEIWLLDWRHRKIEVYMVDDDGTGHGWKEYLTDVYTDENKDQLQFNIFPRLKPDFDAIMDIEWFVRGE